MVEISALIRVSFTLFFACSQPRVNRLTVWKLSSHRLWPEVVLGFWSYFNSRFNSSHWSQLNICIIKLVATRSEAHGMKMLVKFIVFRVHPPHQCRKSMQEYSLHVHGVSVDSERRWTSWSEYQFTNRLSNEVSYSRPFVLTLHSILSHSDRQSS